MWRSVKSPYRARAGGRGPAFFFPNRRRRPLGAQATPAGTGDAFGPILWRVSGRAGTVATHAKRWGRTDQAVLAVDVTASLKVRADPQETEPS